MGKVKAWKSKKIGLPVTEFLDWTKTVVLNRELEHLNQTVSDNTTVHKCVFLERVSFVSHTKADVTIPLNLRGTIFKISLYFRKKILKNYLSLLSDF